MAVRTRLEIFNNDGSGLQSQPFNDNVSVALNFAIADIREPDKRKASRSITISIDATNEINKCFENIFEVNIATQYFNKNLKTPCKYFVDEILNFEGNLQIIKINIKPTGQIEYECSIAGEGGTLFLEIGDKLITGNSDSADDLDFSAYNHTYNRATQISSRATYYGLGYGYLYPFIDKGSNGGSDTVWNTNDFLPCFHIREYIEKIITKAGYTFTSTILDSAEYKKLIVYPNIISVQLSQSQLNDRQFYVGLNSNSARTANAAWATVNYPNETGGDGFFDVGSQVAGTYAILNDSGYYNLAAADYYKISFTHTSPLVVKAQALHQSGKRIRKSSDSGTSWFNISQEVFVNFDNSGNFINKNTDYFWTTQVATGEMLFTTGDYLEAQSYLRLFGITYYDAGGIVVATGTGTVTIELISGAAKTSFYALATKKEIIAGNTLLANNALPIKIKQKDLLMSEVKRLNLYIDLDPNDKNNLIIESFDDFYNTEPILNYEGLTDLDKDQTINPNLLDGKRYIYKYKEDKDKYNEQYKTTWNETFGTQQIDIENDFQKNDKINEILFSPTPNIANYGLGIAHPRIYKEEQQGGVITKKPIVPNIRLLICGGVKTTSNPYTYKEFSNTDLITSDYLYAGHTDDPFNPTIDLNFGLPKEVYYSYVNSYFTTNNSYNRFHKYYLENITNRDSRIETKYIWVNAKNIREFSFRRRIFIDGAYWIVNKIENYNPLKETSTKFELVKLLEANVFTPTTVLISSNTAISNGSGELAARSNSSLSVGNNSINLGSNCLSIGDNNFIPESASNVTVIGNNVVVAEGVSNSSVINTNNYNLTQSNLVINNGSTSLSSLTGEATTTNNTASQIVFNTNTGEFTLENDSVYKVYSKVLAVDTVTGDYKEWEANGIATDFSTIVNYTDLMAVTSVLSTGAMSGCNLIITGLPTEQLNYSIAGLAATTIKWSCEVQYIKINL